MIESMPTVEELVNILSEKRKQEQSNDDDQLKKQYNIEPYNGQPIECRKFELSPVEQHRFNELKRQHCCDIKIVFGSPTAIGTPVFVWIPCKGNLLLDISDYNSW